MSCARLYVEPTEAPMAQIREKSLLRILKQGWEIIRGPMSLIIIITPEENKQSFKEEFYYTWGTLLSTLCHHIISLSPLLLLIFPSMELSFVSYIFYQHCEQQRSIQCCNLCSVHNTHPPCRCIKIQCLK